MFAFLLVGIVAAGAPEFDRPATNLLLGGGASQLLLGSEDRRLAWYGGLQRVTPRSRIRLLGHPDAMAIEGYVMHSHGGGDEGVPRDQSWAIGALISWQTAGAHSPWAFEYGWGLQVANRTTQDIDSQLASTPMIGGIYRLSDRAFLSLRLFHISNAGLGSRGAQRGKNQGQNQLHLLLGWRL